MVDFLYWGKKIGGSILEALNDPSNFTNNIPLPNSDNKSDQDPKFNYEKIMKAIIEELVRSSAAKWYHQQKKNKTNGTES